MSVHVIIDVRDMRLKKCFIINYVGKWSSRLTCRMEKRYSLVPLTSVIFNTLLIRESKVKQWRTKAVIKSIDICRFTLYDSYHVPHGRFCFESCSRLLNCSACVFFIVWNLLKSRVCLVLPLGYAWHKSRLFECFCEGITSQTKSPKINSCEVQSLI